MRTSIHLSRHRSAGTVTLVVLVATALAACGSADPDPGVTRSPEPTVVEVTYELLPPTDPEAEEVLAGRGLSGVTPHAVVERAADGRRLLLVTWGSSSCPSAPVAGEWTGDELAIATDDVAADGSPGRPVACTADLGPTVVAFDVGDLPDGAFTVVVDGEAVVEVAASP